MKLKLSVIITAACLIAGCSSEKTIDKGTPDENGMVYMEFSSRTPVVQTNSRTQLGEDGLGVNWSDGDNISVFPMKVFLISLQRKVLTEMEVLSLAE